MPEVKWIDSDGQQRIHHDDNHQMVMKHGEDDSSWLKMDSWEIDFATAVIVLGYTENIQGHIDYLSNQNNRSDIDRADVMKKILNRFHELAQSAINADILQEYSSPTKWLVWAQSKGYKTDHLISENQVASLTTDHESTNNNFTNNSKINAREGGYKERDEFVIELIKDRPELLVMRPKEIKEELQELNKSLFIAGYDGWWRKQPAFSKGMAGRIPK